MDAVKNILVTLDVGYLGPLTVMLRSLAASNPKSSFQVYILHSSLKQEHLDKLQDRLKGTPCRLQNIRVTEDAEALETAPITDRYPREMYYRLFAARYLPENLERILYLDPDILVINPVDELYNTPFEDCLFAACSHVHESLRRLNERRLHLPKGTPYINSGVMLLNLPLLRQVQRVEEIHRWLREHRRLCLPDQDVISALYGDRIRLLDARKYNLGEKYYLSCRLRPFEQKEPMTLDWVRRNTVCIHYCGRNKPWKPHYTGELGIFYREFLASLPPDRPQKVHGEVRLKRAVPEEKTVLNNLLEKYNYEFSQYDRIPFGPDGLFHYRYLDSYWTESGREAYLIYSGESLAGFALLHKRPECSLPTDWTVAEFFVAYPYRRRGVATAAMERIFCTHPGTWHIKYHPGNTAAVRFWTGLAEAVSGGRCRLVKGTEDYFDGTPSQVLVFPVPPVPEEK